ncbi:QueT transporter family protein [Clostridium sp. Ade.TY]|uniref:QueT transporter family protein n=1 Tax=Clostridium sp. Ade.TY TaxID=1391647 RepID=UPI0004298136|nr:QueT transporter family protein [Clostridium sp. Ade.TY]
MNKTIKRVIISGIIAAMYAVLTLVLSPISYGPIQFRISEIMVLLAYFDPFYIIGLTLGCFIANILGPNGLLDIIFGTFATFLSVLAIYMTSKLKFSDKLNMFIASLWPTVFNALIIGIMLSYLLNLPKILTIIQVGIGEFIVVSAIGVPIIYKLRNIIKNNI